MNEDYYRYTNQFFGKWAPFYNLIAMPLSRIRNKVVNVAKARKGSTVLDVCTGTGAQAFAFGKRGYKVIGIDLSPDMLKVARQKNKYGNVEFKVADAVNIPFEDNSFEVSCISMALHDMPHGSRHEVLDEMKKVLVRGVEISQMMKVVGEEGTSIDDFVIYLKSDLIDSVYLQQNSFDDVDAFCDLDRQKYVFDSLMKIVDAEIKIPEKDSARQFFNSIRQKFIDWNYAKWESDEFKKLESELLALLEEGKKEVDELRSE